jgi:hypothetical protein
MTAIAIERTKTEFAGLVPAKVTLSASATSKYYKGTLVAAHATTGRAVVPTDGDGLAIMGVADATFDNSTGANDAMKVELTPGIHGPFVVSGSAPVPGSLMFAVDNQTISTSDNGATRGIAGVCTKVNADGAFIMIGPGATGLLAAVAGEVASVNALQADALTAQAMINVPLASFRIYSTGGALVPFNDGVADGIDPTAESNGFKFNVASTAAIAASVPMPQDLDDAADIVLHILGFRVGSSDTTAALTVGAFFRVVGSAFSADADAGGATSAFAAATTVVSEVTRTIAAADVPASPSSLLLTLVPTAALDADDLVVTDCWIEYTRKLLTA